MLIRLSTDSLSKAGIDDGATLILVPNNLLAQWRGELYRLLQHGFFDIFEYTGSKKQRELFWTTLWPSSRQPMHRRIILSTISVSLLEPLSHWYHIGNC